MLVHFGFATPEQVERWVELGGIVSANPYYVTALAGRYDKLGIGPERAPNMVPLGRRREEQRLDSLSTPTCRWRRPSRCS